MDSITGSNVFSVEPLIRLIEEVIDEEESLKILQTNLLPMDFLLYHISTVLQDQQAHEVLKVWLQLLHNCVAQAKNMLHRSNSRQRFLDWLSNKPGRPSKQIRNWRLHFNYLFQGLEREYSVFVRGREAVIAPVIASIIPLMKAVIEEEEEHHTLQTELKPLDNLLLDMSVVFQDQHQAAPETLKIWLQLLHNCLTEAKSMLQLYAPSQRQRRRLDCLIGNGGRSPQEVNKWKVLFNFLFQGLQEDFSMFVTSTSHLIFKRDPISIEVQRLSRYEGKRVSKNEAWMLFRKFAFKDNRVPTDIEEFATKIADECKGFLLATILVAAAMRGKTRIQEWKTSLSSIKNANFSSPDTVHLELYKALRWSYDALPNSYVKNCFLYCAMYPKDEDINVQELVQMWIAEGFVSSKQENHLMDMAIGRSYVKLLLDRCFFRNPTDESAMLRGFVLPQDECIYIVHHAVREMAIYIGEQEEDCLFKARQGLQNFPTIDNENCKRISVQENDFENLPAELPCPKLVSLMLSTNNSNEEVPPGFLVSLTSLRVLSQKGSEIISIPSSVGQLKQLEFLSLSIQELPEEIGHISSLQFLELGDCRRLQSLPSKIGDLKNLKYLGLGGCDRLKVIPHEIWQLTSLSTLNAPEVELSVEAESEVRSIWRLKGLRNLTMLRITVELTSSGIIEEGIMGTWLNMRHLWLKFKYEYDDDDVMVDLPQDMQNMKVGLPQDMQNMKRLQLFGMEGYHRSSLPEYICNFQHLEGIFLRNCHQLQKLSPLERVPNLKTLLLRECDGLKELGIGKSGEFLMLEQLIFRELENLESIGRASDNDVWNESTLPRLRSLVVGKCPKLKRLPVGMDKLPKLTAIVGEDYWWRQIIWDADGDMKTRLQSLYKEW